MSEALECVGNCPCGEPRDWKSQNISMNNLVQVEIYNFKGEARDMDFLTSIFKWAPMLKRMTIRMTSRMEEDRFRACTMDTQNIFSIYPSVNCSLVPAQV
jgi:hypothetical protein